MNIFDTLSGNKIKIVKPKQNYLKVFVCGPTVYDYIHLGNARTYLIFDSFVTYLRSLGFNIFYLQNITDIDNKIIERAKENNISPKELAQKFEKIYLADEKSLGIKSVSKHARATKYIKEIVKQIQTLINKGYAYKIPEDGYYFNINKFSDYGKLSKRTILQAEDSISRIDDSVHKINKGDFTLWKFYKTGEPFWDTPLGKGRPGWHIEDTAITEKYFGPQYDIHGAAVDLLFPHHEAELAQQESASGKTPFVKIWMHSGFLNFKDSKMSKSSGEFISVRDFLKTTSPNALRILVLSHHYRSPIDFSDEVVLHAKNEWNNILQFYAKLIAQTKNKKIVKHKPQHIKIKQEIKNASKLFQNALDDDFNTPNGLAVLHLLINQTQPIIYFLSNKESCSVAVFVMQTLESLGFTLKLPKIPPKIRKISIERELLRSNKQFTQSDDLRKEMDELGYTVEDTPLGSFLWPK